MPHGLPQARSVCALGACSAAALLALGCGRFGYENWRDAGAATDASDAAPDAPVDGPDAAPDSPVDAPAEGAADADDADVPDACVPVTETCNGRDDDCDGATDEVDGAALCAGGAICWAGECHGEFRWDRLLVGSAGMVFPDSVAALPPDALVVAGYFMGTVDFGGGERTASGAQSCFLVAYDTAGAYLWDREIATCAPQDLRASLTGDLLCLAGYFVDTTNFGGGDRTSAGPFSRDEAFVACYDRDGGYAWDRTWGDIDHDMALGVTVDTDGVVITGYIRNMVDLGGSLFGEDGIQSTFVLALGLDGAFEWATAWPASGVVYDACPIRRQSGTGDVFVTGRFSGTVSFGDAGHTSYGSADGFISSLADAGAYRWDRTFGGILGADLGARIVDVGDGIVVGGAFGGETDFGGGSVPSLGLEDGILVRYGYDGAYVAMTDLGRGAVTSLAAGTSGTLVTVVAVGQSLVDGESQGLVALVDETLGERWRVEYEETTETGYVSIRDVAVVGDACIAFAGSFSGDVDFGAGTHIGEGPDGFVVCLDP